MFAGGQNGDDGNTPDIRNKRIGAYRVILLLLAVALFELVVSDYMYTFDGMSHNDRRGGHILQTLMQFNKKRRVSIHQSAKELPLPTKANHTIALMLEKVGLEVTQELLDQFPPIDQSSELYGDEVLIPGLETCEQYQNAVTLEDRHTGPAGMFNTGTNLMYDLLHENCKLPNRRFGVIWQVPWGKHQPLSSKNRNFPKHWLSVEHEDVLPLVVIKDPLTWMGSMCRNSYSAHWIRTSDHCPNLIKLETDKVKADKEKEEEFRNIRVGEPIPVSVKYNSTQITYHENLVGLWNDYYGAYWKDPSPKLFVRYEDLLFRPEETISKVCSCIGGNFSTPGNFHFVKRSAKGNAGVHHGSSDLVGALLRYSNAQTRIQAFTPLDLKSAAAELNTELLDAFHYPIPELPLAIE